MSEGNGSTLGSSDAELYGGDEFDDVFGGEEEEKEVEDFTESYETRSTTISTVTTSNGDWTFTTRSTIKNNRNKGRGWADEAVRAILCDDPKRLRKIFKKKPEIEDLATPKINARVMRVRDVKDHGQICVKFGDDQRYNDLEPRYQFYASREGFTLLDMAHSEGCQEEMKELIRELGGSAKSRVIKEEIEVTMNHFSKEWDDLFDTVFCCGADRTDDGGMVYTYL